MDVNKQSQQAGEGSQLVQAGTIVINQGVSEERVRTVFNEMVPRALEEYTKEAYTKANERITNWENSVLPRVNEVKGMLEAFADPAFQQVLRKAQQSAAVTDEKADYDLLTELLVCHVEKGDSRKNCNGVQREHNKKLNNGLPILHKVPPKRDYGRYFCILAEKGGTSHGGLTEKLSPFFYAQKQEVNAYGR